MPLREATVRDPEPGLAEVLIGIGACGVCRTDLHLADGELRAGHLPLILGHQIIGRVQESRSDQFAPGDRIGVPWVAWTCGACRFCHSGAENLCQRARFTGSDVDGGYAELAVAHGEHCFALPEGADDSELAPLLCAGMIGYRALRLAGDGDPLGLYGFGAAAHLICQVAVREGRRVFAFTRPGDAESQAFARSLGAAWAGGSDEAPPELLGAALIFAAVGALVPLALRASDRGATVVCAGIHMSDVPAFPYELLWQERVLRSVANLTREDGRALLAAVAEMPLRVTTTLYPLSRANAALEDLRAGRLQGAAVLTME